MEWTVKTEFEGYSPDDLEKLIKERTALYWIKQEEFGDEESDDHFVKYTVHPTNLREIVYKNGYLKAIPWCEYEWGYWQPYTDLYFTREEAEAAILKIKDVKSHVVNYDNELIAFTKSIKVVQDYM